jgi:hypothetical protein
LRRNDQLTNLGLASLSAAIFGHAKGEFMAKFKRQAVVSLRAEHLRQPGQCVMVTDRPNIAWLFGLSGNRATLETGARPAIGTRVELHHPEAGVIAANVVERLKNGVAIAFNAGDRAIAFTLSTLARDLKSV